MDYLYTIVLAIIQGVAEFLPISSSGHLLLAEHLLPVNHTSFLFELILNLGTISALILFFFKEWIMILDIRKKENLWLWLYIIVATIATVGIGLFVRSFTKSLDSLIYLSIGFIVTGKILYSTKNINKQNQTLSIKKSLWIGLAQGFTVLPGISRSGTTIAIGRHLGLENRQAFLFSFMLSVPVGIGAVVLELLKSFHRVPSVELTQQLSLSHAILGFIVAFVFGFLALKLFYRLYISAYFYRFAYYCFTIGLIALGLGVLGI